MPDAHFDMLRLEELLVRQVAHDISKIHIVEFYHILIVTKGQGYHTIDFTDYHYEKGTILTIRKDQIHKFFRSANVSGFLLLFTDDFILSHFSEQEALKAKQLFNELLGRPKIQLNEHDFEDVLDLIKHIEVEYKALRDEFSNGIIRCAVHMLIIKLFRVKANVKEISISNKYLERFVEFQKLVELHCFETKKVLDYARMMNCTARTLNTAVRDTLHKSAKGMIDDLVITQIKRLLINTTLSITEIAYTAGFEEPTNMYKYFKKHTGSSPKAFQESYF